MDPNAWQAYQAAAAYTNRFSSSQQDDNNPYHNPAFLLAHQQLREAASQHYQNQILPPSLVQAAANNKNQLHQQALANLNMRESVMSSNALLTPPVTPVSTAWSKSSNENSRSRDEQPQQRRSVIEAKTSQPAFPGQPPPLTDSRVGRNVESPTPSFAGQPPPRQSSQPRSSSQAAFTGLSSSSNHYPQQHSPQYGNTYSPQAPSPQGYHNVHSPQEYHPSQRRDQERKVQNSDRHQRDERDRQRRELERARIEQEKQIRDMQRQDEKLREEKERQERREQERMRQEQEIRREQERIRQEEQEMIRQEQDRQERLRKEQERMKQEQEERKRREQIERQKQEQERIRREQEKIRIEHERKKREDERRRREEMERQQRKDQERQRVEQEKIREQERIRQEQEKIRKEQEMIRQEQDRIIQEQERLEQQKMQEEQRDLGLARLSAMGALNDLGEEPNNYQYDQSIAEHPNPNPNPAFQSGHGINFHEINMFNQNRQNIIKQESNEQKPFVNHHYNTWINRANELLDLSSSDSRETPVNNEGEQAGLIPQILMNPWDPQQAPMMTLAPIANAMQQYQQQWLSQYQQAAGMLQQDEESYPLGKFRVLCISPDEEMGFLINLPAPCNLLFQSEGLVLKNVDSPFLSAFQKFLKDPEGSTRKNENLTEAPDKPPPILPGKKEYIPPYTPKATVGPESKDGKVKVSSSGLSRSLVIEPVKKSGHQAKNSTSPVRATVARSSSQSKDTNSHSVHKTSGSGQLKPGHKKNKTKAVSDDEAATSTPQELPKRETSRRKAKEQASSKRQAQDKLLMDEDDPTLNNPALDLEDSDDDAEWTPVKEAEAKGGRMRKRGAGDSSDEEDFSEFNNKMKFKKRAYPEPEKTINKRLSTENNSESTNNTSVPEGEEFKVGSFLILKTETSSLKPSLWRVDGKTLIQKYECLDEEGIKYKNVNTYSGWTASTRHRYTAVSVKVISTTGQDIIVERLQDDEDPKNLSSETSKTEEPKETPKKPINIEEIQLKSRGETGQFQENFEVYMQTLISQCLDANFLNEIFSEADEYFVSNIEKVDSVTLLRKDKLLAGVTWTLRFQHALTVWPCLNDLGSEACTSTVCGSCEKARAHTMLQMFGQPYNPNTLATIPPNPEAMMNRNFSVCKECSRLCHLYHRLHHQKQKLYMMCSEIVERRKTESPDIDTTQILNQLLADDAWLETQFKKMQDLWADADCFVN